MRARSFQACLKHTQELVEICQKLGWLVNVEKLFGSQPSFRLSRLPVRPQVRSGLTNTGPVAEPSTKNTHSYLDRLVWSGNSCPVTFANCHRKACSPRPTAYETYTLASQNPLERSGIIREVHSNTQVPAPQWWLKEGNLLQGQPLHPLQHALLCTYQKKGGRSFKRAYCKRNLVPSRKQAAYKLFGTKSSLLSTERVPRPLPRQDHSSCSNRQHHSGVIHKQGWRHEVGSTLCPTMENLDLVFQETSDSKSQTHSRLTKRGSRQAIQARPDHPNRMVSASRGLPNNIQQMAPARNRPYLFLCHRYRIPWLQQWMHSVCHGRIWTHMPSQKQPSWAK